jgi:hypothetical protein
MPASQYQPHGVKLINDAADFARIISGRTYQASDRAIADNQTVVNHLREALDYYETLISEMKSCEPNLDF